MKLIIEADNVNIDTKHYDNQVILEITNPFIGFIKDLEINDIISYADNEKLLKAIIENDGDILTKYLKDNGYGHFYVKG